MVHRPAAARHRRVSTIDMTIKVSRVDRATNKLERLVTYKLRAGKVVADWSTDVQLRHRGFIERDGIYAPGGLFHLEDGKQFMDALKNSFIQSTGLVVEVI